LGVERRCAESSFPDIMESALPGTIGKEINEVADLAQYFARMFRGQP